MTCSYPYGPQIQLLYDLGGSNPLSVTFTDAAGNFRCDDGTDRLSQTGYDKVPQAATVAQAVPTAMGAARYSRPIYRPKFEIKVRLQQLTDLQTDTTIAMIERSRLDLRSITLYDQRLVTREPTPRTRAKIGTVTGAPTVAGVDLFFPQLLIWITQYSEPYRLDQDNNYLDFEAIEIGAPIPPTADQ